IVFSTIDGSVAFEENTHQTTLLEFSPDGSLLLQGGYRPSNLTLWDMEKKARKWSISSDHFWGMAACFISGGRELLLQCHNSPTVVLQVEDGSLIRKIGQRNAELLTVSPDEKRILTMDSDGGIWGLDFADGGVRFEVPTGNQLTQFRTLGLCFTTEGDRFVSALPASDGTQEIQIRDSNNGSLVRSLLGGSGPVWGAIVHPLTSELVVLGKETKVWSLGEAGWIMRGNYAGAVSFWHSDDILFGNVDRSPLVKLLQLQRNGNAKTLWTPPNNPVVVDVDRDYENAILFSTRHNTSPGELKALIAKHDERAGFDIVSAFNFDSISSKFLRLSPDGMRVAAIKDNRGNASVFSAETGTTMLDLKQSDIVWFSDLEWLTNDRIVGLVAVNARRGEAASQEKIAIWDVETGSIVAEADYPSPMNVIAVFSNGDLIAEAGFDKRIRIRDASTLSIVNEFRAHDAEVVALTWHPKLQILASASSDLRVRLWDLSSREQLDDLLGPRGPVHSLSFSKTGGRLASASYDSRICVWEPSSLRGEDGDSSESMFGKILRKIVDSRKWPAISQALVILARDYPGDAQTWNELPDLLHSVGSREEIETVLESALKNSQMHPLVRLTRARTRIASNDWAGALLDLDFGLNTAFSVLEDYALRARAHGELGNYEQALEDWKIYLSEKPESHFALFERAMIHSHLELWKESRRDFAAAIELAPEESSLRYRNARALSYWLPRGEWEKAELDLATIHLDSDRIVWGKLRIHTLVQLLQCESDNLPSLVERLKLELSSDLSEEQIRCSLIPILLSSEKFTASERRSYLRLAGTLRPIWKMRLTAVIRLRSSEDPGMPENTTDAWLQMVAAIYEKNSGKEDKAKTWLSQAEESLLDSYRGGAVHEVPASTIWLEWAPNIILFRMASELIEGDADAAERRLVERGKALAVQ
ncbi:MAG: hypothetical protein AAF226_06985, partial [Verrucomicrobiota bacterium]